ncbi:hypothetical protein JOD48_003818 [Oerskovia paurometabola]|nr:hypothetical protein [Oerskovia paurometabola]MBM7495346.1 hypothetical protein [Oerskovia paurometabola]MBM7499156.1 hypothetical protein [Oerskovia paurometabola]MBM7499159.1 hypothetical protein [Oerskovia paurometabola]
MSTSATIIPTDGSTWCNNTLAGCAPSIHLRSPAGYVIDPDERASVRDAHQYLRPPLQVVHPVVAVVGRKVGHP